MTSLDSIYGLVSPTAKTIPTAAPGAPVPQDPQIAELTRKVDALTKQLEAANKKLEIFEKALGNKLFPEQVKMLNQPPVQRRTPQSDPKVTMTHAFGPYEKVKTSEFLAQRGFSPNPGETPREGMRRYWKSREYNPKAPENQDRENKIEEAIAQAKQGNLQDGVIGLKAAKEAGKADDWKKKFSADAHSTQVASVRTAPAAAGNVQAFSKPPTEWHNSNWNTNPGGTKTSTPVQKSVSPTPAPILKNPATSTSPLQDDLKPLPNPGKDSLIQDYNNLIQAIKRHKYARVENGIVVNQLEGDRVSVGYRRLHPDGKAETGILQINDRQLGFKSQFTTYWIENGKLNRGTFRTNLNGYTTQMDDTATADISAPSP